MLEALALSLSMTTLSDIPSDSQASEPARPRPVLRKAPPPAPPRPIESPPPPPETEPVIPPRPNHARHLPVMFPPVGHAWNRSPLARAMRPPMQQFRPWGSRKETVRYFPASNRWYGLRRRRNPRFTPLPRSDSSGPSEDDAKSEATSTVSTAPSYHRNLPPEFE